MHGYRTYSRGAVDSSYCRLHYRKYLCTTRVHVSTPYVTICTFHDSYESYERKIFNRRKTCMYLLYTRKNGKPVKMTMSSYRSKLQV